MSEGRAFIVRLLEGITAFFLVLFAVLRPLSSGDLLGLGDTIQVSLPVWFAFLFWLLRCLAEGRLRVFAAGWDVCLIGLVLLVLLSPRPPANFNLALPSAMAWATNVLYLYMVINVGREARFARWILAALMATALVIAVYGAVQTFFDLPKINENLEARSDYRLIKARNPELMEEYNGRVRTGRPFASFCSEDTLAGFLAMMVFPCLGVFVERLRERKRWAYQAAVGLLFLLVLWRCKSKGAGIALGVGAVAFLCGLRIGPFARRWVRLLVLPAGVCLAVGLIALSWTRLDPLEIHKKCSSAWFRIGYWKGAVRVFQAHPLRGVGLENFQDHYDSVKDAEAGEVRRVHNDYLQVAVELGAFGLLAFAGFWVATVLRLFRPARVDVDAPPEGRVWLRLTPLFLASLAAGVLGTLFVDRTVGLDSETLGEVFVYLLVAVWVLSFLDLRPAMRQPSSPYLRAGLLAGLCAALAHAGIDYDFYVHGLAFTIWALAGVAIALDQDARRVPPAIDVELGAAGSLLVLGIAGAFAAVLVGAIIPVMRRAQAEEELFHESEGKRARHPNFVEAGRLAPWDTRPLLEEAAFRHGACEQAVEEYLKNEHPMTDPGSVAQDLSERWAACTVTLDEAVRMVPRERTAWALAARFHEEHAEAALELSAQDKSASKSTLERLAREQYEAALTDYRASYDLYPTLPESSWKIGSVLEKLGRTEEARPFLEHALRMHRLQVLDRLRLPADAVAELEKRFGGVK